VALAGVGLVAAAAFGETTMIAFGAIYVGMAAFFLPVGIALRALNLGHAL